MFNGVQLRDAIISGANTILKNKKKVDDLNIFPVPDGDTGTNMSMTMAAAAEEMQDCDTSSASEVLRKAASAMLRGARGNSGVILSLLFKGFAKGIVSDEISGEDIVSALNMGVDAAYKAVMKPTEGTILTVARVACERGRAAAEQDNDALSVWTTICSGALEALDDTPKLLPVLKKAGVVDAGGMGLCMIFDGMLSVFRDNVIVEKGKSEEQASTETEAFFSSAAAEFDQDITFTYCTECIIGRGNREDPVKLRIYLETIGDCVVVADDDDIIKVHVHTEKPGNVLQEGLKFGQLLKVKIENMKEQHRKAAEANEKAKAKAAAKALEPADPEEEIGFVAVAAGDGLANLFRDLGCAQVVSGGQTMNPSTEDIIEAVLATPAKKVFVLPNNKNIIMAAEQAVPLVKDREVIVIPTRTVPQGMSAMLAVDPDAPADRLAEDMTEAAKNVATGQVTFAARDSEFGGQRIKQNDILGMENGKLTMVEHEIAHTAVKLTKSMVTKDTGFITLIYGQGVSEEEANEVCEELRSKLGESIEITLVSGGQPVYYYIISVE